MEVTTYNIKDVDVIAADHIVTGYSDGDAISLSRSGDDITPHVGAKGDVTYAENADETATLTLNLKESSPSLNFFKNLRKQKTIFPIHIHKKSGNKSREGGTKARVTRMPDKAYGTETPSREVQIHIANCKED